MTPTEIADKLASDAAGEMPIFIEANLAPYIFKSGDATKKIGDVCCLKELLEVAEASQTLKTCWRKTFFKGTVTVRNLDKALIALSEKLKARGIELHSSPKKEGR